MASSEGEPERLARVFAGYRADASRRRRWAPENAGNLAIRDELATATLALLAELSGTERLGTGAILDAGCGSGWWLERLLAAGVGAERLTGAELLPERVSAARERLPSVTILSADIRALTGQAGAPAPGRCTLITFFAVLSGMGGTADVARALSEARRLLAPGGVIAIWEPRVPTRNAATRLISRHELARALGPDLRIRSITLAPPLARRAGRAYRTLAAIPFLRSHRLVVARPAAASGPC